MGSQKKSFFKSKLFSLLALLVAMFIIFTVWSKIIGVEFLSLDTILLIGDSLVVTSFLAVGSGFLMVSGKMDLSASAIGAFGSVFLAAVMKYYNMNPAIAIILTLILCAGFGLINGLLVNEFNFQPFIATMAMASVAKGMMQWVSVDPTAARPTAATINYSNAITKFIGTEKIGGFSVMLILSIIVFVVYGLILSKSKFGMHTYLVGGNPQAAYLTGISPKKITYILFANSGFLAGVAGVIYMGRTSQGDLNALMLNQFTGLTAAILGGISFGGGNGNMAGVFVGLMILNTFNIGTTIVRFNNYWTTVLSGLLLLAALTMDYYSARKAQKAVLK